MTSDSSSPPERQVKDDSSEVTAQATEGFPMTSPQMTVQNPELARSSDMTGKGHPVSDDKASPDAVTELEPSTSATDGALADTPSIEDNILKSTPDAIAASGIKTSSKVEDKFPVAPNSTPDRNKMESGEVNDGPVASTVVNPPSQGLEDADQKQCGANNSIAEAAFDKSQPDTASSLTIDNHVMSDDDIEKELKSLVKEECMLQCRESEDSWTPQDATRLHLVRERSKQLSEVMMKQTLPQAKAAAKCFGHNQLPKSSAPLNKAKQATYPNKRKLETSEDDTQVAKKPRTHKKPLKGQSAAVDYVTKSMLNQMTGGGEENFNADAIKHLQPISKAPVGIREHLKAIQAAGLRLPNAKPEMIKAHAKALGGISQAFRTIVSPWVTEGDGEKTVEDFKWLLQGMRHPLHHHQLVAAGNMSTIENDNESDSIIKFGLQSGFLYDWMGYGKTPETLACIVSNPPRGKRSTNGSSTTLVVVPKSAAQQWADEVENHCTDLKATLYSKDSDTTKSNWKIPLSADILIVTYDQLRSTHQRVQDKKISKSLLFDSNYHRVVLDESHRIKNPGSETFKVCLALKSKHKWCLTGTPIQNGVFEIYAPLKFLGHPLVGEVSDFKKKFLGGRGGKNLPTEGPRYSELSQILEPVMIMRTPGHSFLGSPLVNLPESHASLIYVELSQEEEVIQEYLDKHMGAYLKKKESPKKERTKKSTKKPGRRGKSNTQTVDVPIEKSSLKSLNEVLMRKRQFVASPALLENLVKDGIWTLDQIKSMRQEAQKDGISDTPFINLFEKWFKEPKPSKFLSRGRKAAAEWAMMQAASCAQCHKPHSDETEPQESECGCRYCKSCLEYLIDFSRYRRPEEEPRCTRCSGEIGAYHPYSLPPMDSADFQKTKTNRPRLRGDDYNTFQPQDASGSTLMRNVDALASVPLSSKMKATLKQIQEWQQEARDDKMIVFSSFIGASRLLARVLQDDGIDFLYFVGEMNAEQRQRAISAFKTNGDIKVLLMSTKCGSESLNLTAGNRIILLDPWYNRSVESQSIARVYRMGQTKVTHTARILAKNTIDIGIYNLQEKKLDQMEGSLQEFHAEKGLGARALRRLLGDRWKVKGDDDDDDDDDDSSGEETDFDFVVKDDDTGDDDYED